MSGVPSVEEAFRVALSGGEARVVQIPHPKFVFLAQNSEGRSALVVRVDGEPQSHVVPDGRGYTAEFGSTGSGRVLRLTSTRRGRDLLFEKLVEYVLEQTARPHKDGNPVEEIIVALTAFRAFSQRRPGRLTESEIRGLFAEWSFLLELHRAREMDPMEVFASWGGPFGSLHDVSLASGETFEVKSAHRPPTTVRITDATQVMPTVSPLWIAVLPIDRVARGTPGSTSFLEIGEEVAALAGRAGGEVIDVWNAALEALGLDLADRFYEQWAFLPDEWRIYRLGAGFPHIAEESIPPGVRSVSFSLDLGVLESFRIDGGIQGARA